MPCASSRWRSCSSRARQPRADRRRLVGAVAPGAQLELDGRFDLDRAGAVADRRAVERVGPAVIRRDRAQPGGIVEPGDDAGQWMILASGSSMMSVAPASFRAGINVLIVAFGTTVSTAKQSLPNNSDTVGDFIEGTSAITASRSAADTLSFPSTLPRASSVPCSSVRI